MSGDNKELTELLKWSLKLQQDESSPGKPMDPERMQFLKEALADICNQPSETDLLKATLAVLKVNYSSSLCDSSQVSQLEEAFEQLQYFIEDLDHANDLRPLGGVEVLLQYLEHSNHKLVEYSCGAIATACQNNMKCQELFYSALPQLVAVMKDAAIPPSTRTKALSTVSSVVRDFPPGREVFFRSDGLPSIIGCLDSGVDKLVAKALFVLSYFYRSGSEGALKERCCDLLCKSVGVLERATDVQVVSHLITLLNTVIQTCVDQYKLWKTEQHELADKLNTSVREKCQLFELQKEEEVATLLSSLNIKH